MWRLAGVIGMISAIHDGDLKKIEWAYPVEASDVHTIEVGIGSSLEMRGDPASRAEKVPRGSGVEAVAGKRIYTAHKRDAARLHGDDDRPTHSAIRAITAADRGKAVDESDLETHRSAMALTGSNARVALHL